MNQEEKKATNQLAGGAAPDFNQIENDILKFWEENKIFEKSLEQNKDKEPFIFYDGPPFATGLPHYGSLLSSIVKDVFGRFQAMQGKYVRRRWGWDCHGLPIENIVEQNLKISGKKQIEEVGVERFNKVCRDNVLKYTVEWGKLVKRVGRWVDFEHSYKTMDTSYQESVWWAIKQLWQKKLVYEDRKVLLYCSRCETPISNFEVAMDNSYKDITEESVFVKFKILPRQRIVNDLTDEKTYALAWTTTPWTLPGNTALNIGPEIKYVLVEQNGEKYFLAKDLLSVLEGQYEIVAEYQARSLEGLQYEPLFSGVIPQDSGRQHRIYSADFVTITDGTGIVHNAAMYGEEDYQLAKEKNLPRVDMLDHKGQYVSEGRIPEFLRGVFFKDAEKPVVKDLRQRNLLYKTVNFTHSYPHCYRCATPLFYNALPAWFINIQKVKTDLLKANEVVSWYPEHLKYGRFGKSVQAAPDWNISRNRYWATALPFWKCENLQCKNVTCVGSIEELVENSENFSEVYPHMAHLKLKIREMHFDKKPLSATELNLEQLDLHRPYIDLVKLKCEKCQAQMSRIPEVVDCWVESSSMPFAELHYPFENFGEKNAEDFKNRFPADFVAEYIPQTRAWFYVMHVLSTVLFGQSPFKNVVTTGTVLAEDGSKMSKSKNNFPDPTKLIERYSTDALRFYLLSSPVMNAEDLNFAEKGVSEINRKLNFLLYNVWSFFRMYKKSAVSSQQSAVSSDNILDQWILSKLAKTHREVTENLNSYNTVKPARCISEFVAELSTWYVRRSRDRIKEGNENAEQALSTLGFVLVETTKLLAPFVPFLAEFVFKDLTEKESVHLELWTKDLSVFENQKIETAMTSARILVETGLSLRKEIGLKVRQPLAEVEYFLRDKSLFTEDLEKVIAEELNVKKVSGRSDFMPKAGWVFRDEQLFKFALNIELSDELKKEGLARELERQVQDLRKKSGLKVGELVDVYYNTQSEGLEDCLLSMLDRKKTFVNQIQKSFEVEVDFETQGEVEGQGIWLGIIKI